MKIKFSIIIPFYNSEKTIGKCLKAISNSNYKNYEVITVSDNSKDRSSEIVKKFKCKILKLNKRRGAGFARNAGSKLAKGNYLLFLDSDVIIGNRTLSHFNKEIKNKKKVIQGVYSNKPNYKSAVTQYQQCFYIFYTWHKDLKYTSTLVTNCFAIEKKIFNEVGGFNNKITGATSEDEEFGYKILKKGYKIYISRKIQVIHDVNYSFQDFVNRSFVMYFNTIKSFLRNKLISHKTEQKNYKSVLLSIPLSGLIFISLFLFILFKEIFLFYSFAIFLSLHFILNYNFLKFVLNTKGLAMALGAMFYNIIDNILMGSATFFGMIHYFLGKKY